MSATAHTLPSSIDIERALLGTVMMQVHALRACLSILVTPDAFYLDKHKLVYGAILKLADRNEEVDNLTITHQLIADGTLKRAGGAHYVNGLPSGNPALIERYCRILQQQQARRVIITAGTRMEQHGHDEGLDPLELMSSVQVELTRLQQGMETRQAASAASLLPAVLERIRRAVGMKGMTGIPTGLTELNTATGGWQPKSLVVIGARPGMGKTASLLFHAREAAIIEGVPTGIFSMEMPAEELVERLLATEVNGYSNSDLRRGNLAGGVEEVEHLARKAQRLASADNLFIDDTPALNLHQLSAKAARMVAEHGVRFILIDYLQLMSGTAKAGRSGNRESEISEISRGLKALAKELNVPIIALAQLSRSVENRGGEKRPQLSDLRESGAIEQDADMIIFLWRGEYYKIEEYADGTATAGTILYDVAKHRGGALGEMIFQCNISRGLFADLDASPLPAGERPMYVGNGEVVQLGRLPVSTFDDDPGF